MTHISWNDSFNTGIEVIDFQHRKIVLMINDLDSPSATDEQAVIEDVLNRMREYIAEHFTFEEEMMYAADYLFTEAHIKLHQRFLARLDTMAQQHKSEERIIHELVEFLGNWLTHHIGHEDQDYVADVSRVMNEICN